MPGWNLEKKTSGGKRAWRKCLRFHSCLGFFRTKPDSKSLESWGLYLCIEEARSWWTELNATWIVPSALTRRLSWWTDRKWEWSRHLSLPRVTLSSLSSEWHGSLTSYQAKKAGIRLDPSMAAIQRAHPLGSTCWMSLGSSPLLTLSAFPPLGHPRFLPGQLQQPLVSLPVVRVLSVTFHREVKGIILKSVCLFIKHFRSFQ